MYKHNYYNYNMSAIDGMEGHEFEYFCAELLQKNGFSNVRVTPGSGDQGVDVIASKDGIKYAIQCKNYASALSNTPVQEVTAGKQFYGCHVGVVMTNSTFSPGAIQLAKATNVLLWDRTKLLEFIGKAGGPENLGLSAQTDDDNDCTNTTNTTNINEDNLYDPDDKDDTELEDEPHPRRGMKIWSNICIGWSIVCSLVYIILKAFGSEYEMIDFAGVALGEGFFVLVIGIMLRLLSKTQKENPYIYFGEIKIRKPAFVIICVLIAYALLFGVMSITGGLNYIMSY